MLSRLDLDREQLHGVELAKNTPRCGLFLPMNFGKTVITLTAIVDLMFDKFAVTKTLIVAPPKVAESVWHTEAAKWSHTRDLKVSPCLGTPKQREAILGTFADVYVISVNSLRWLIDEYGLDQFDLLVLDEASLFKDSTSKRSKALYADIRKRTDLRLIELTGSPTGNSLENLFFEVKLLDGGARLGSTLTEFRSRYMLPAAGKGAIVYSWKPKPGALEQVTELIKDICFSMPPRNEIKVERIKVKVPVPKPAIRAMREYARALKDGFEAQAEALTLAGNVTAANRLLASGAGKLAGKIRELSSGACYNPDKTGYIEFDRSKIDALVAEIAKRKTRVVVAYWYQHELERICQALPHAVLYEGKKQEDAWNAGQIDVLLLHPQSGGHGLNLQFGGHVMIWFSIIRSQEMWSQTCMRLPRRGQKNDVKLVHLIAEGSSDEAALQALLTNQQNEQAVIDAVMQSVD